MFGGLSETPTSRAGLDRVNLVDRLRASRRRRAEIFGATIARDLPWDILLVLYASEDRNRPTITSVQADVDAPLTTVLRWVKVLEEQNYVVRVRHPHDRRIAYITLSAEGKAALDEYFDAVSTLSR